MTSLAVFDHQMGRGALSIVASHYVRSLSSAALVFKGFVMGGTAQAVVFDGLQSSTPRRIRPRSRRPPAAARCKSRRAIFQVSHADRETRSSANSYFGVRAAKNRCEFPNIPGCLSRCSGGLRALVIGLRL